MHKRLDVVHNYGADKVRSTKFYVDYRKLNDVPQKNSYMSARIHSTIGSLVDTKWFVTVYLTDGYWQVELHSEDKEKSAFSICYG